MHISSVKGQPIVFLTSNWSKIELWIARNNANCDVAAWLVDAILGTRARQHFRSSARTFPLHAAENYYSVSHSTVATVLAISRAPIGVDIEQRIVNECLPDMVWALSAGEREEIRAEGGGNVLTEIWTAKEAAGKALGVGLLAMPSGFVSRAVPGMPSVRTVSVPATVADRTSVETCGVWIGDHHLRVAWGAVPEGG
ncbi:4'-phosphopantetheinyl transferase superfamily protein [Leifsonia sp. NCR5]|uniref:4'-phosphopantetheinyl transferase family protein n=1 Tax=Leifsonia sp. NCR5 TaxID=1978342 RepID=UPI0015C4DABD|nr:4'-phosphopantetheinyl transferase superfamily protein [Leifsonia sp. NCR5]